MQSLCNCILHTCRNHLARNKRGVLESSSICLRRHNEEGQDRRSGKLLPKYLHRERQVLLQYVMSLQFCIKDFRESWQLDLLSRVGLWRRHECCECLMVSDSHWEHVWWSWSHKSFRRQHWANSSRRDREIRRGMERRSNSFWQEKRGWHAKIYELPWVDWGGLWLFRYLRSPEDILLLKCR